MSDLLPAPTTPPLPPETSYASFGPVAAYGERVSHGGGARFLRFLCRLWWVPTLTVLLALGAAVGFVISTPPTFVSKAALWEAEKFQLHKGLAFTEDAERHLDTQIRLLNSGRMWRMAPVSLQAAGTNTIPLDERGNPLKVKLTVTQAPKNSILLLEASSSDPAYAQAALDALMNEFLEVQEDRPQPGLR